MCKHCDCDSNELNIFYDEETDRFYLDIITDEWDYYYDGFKHEIIYINYCPWCGRKLEAGLS